MSFEDVKKIITIDDDRTLRRDEGFGVDLISGDIFLCAIIPDKRKCIQENIEKAVRMQRSRRPDNLHFFPENFYGLSETTPHEALILTMKSPNFETAEFTVGNVIIRKAFTFREAAHSKNDVVLSTFKAYTRKEYGENVGIKELVSTANWKINDSAVHAMQDLQIPYLSHSHGRISCFSGRFTINKPLRDIVSMINMFQFSHYLKTGDILFSKNEILAFVGEEERQLSLFTEEVAEPLQLNGAIN